jgi:hypothetical protein
MMHCQQAVQAPSPPNKALRPMRVNVAEIDATCIYRVVSAVL